MQSTDKQVKPSPIETSEPARRASHGSTGLVYLATPYSDPNPFVREARFKAVNYQAAELMRQGVHIYSPISHTHPIAVAGNLPKGWDYWEQYDRTILAACTRMIVFRQPGWERSKGVAAEMAIAKEMGLPIEFIAGSMAAR